MADKNNIVMIKLDRPRMLWFGHKALKTLTAMTGKDLDAAMNMDELDFSEIETIMYCGLLKDAQVKGETLELSQMEDLLDEAPYSEIISKLEDAFSASFGKFYDGAQAGKN